MKKIPKTNILTNFTIYLNLYKQQYHSQNRLIRPLRIPLPTFYPPYLSLQATLATSYFYVFFTNSWFLQATSGDYFSTFLSLKGPFCQIFNVNYFVFTRRFIFKIGPTQGVQRLVYFYSHTNDITRASTVSKPKQPSPTEIGVSPYASWLR